MNDNLLEALINRGIMRQDTEFVAKYLATGLDGECNRPVSGLFVTKSVVKIKGKFYIKAIRKDNEEQYKIDPVNVVEMDGMDPARLANIFNIKPDGSKQKIKRDEFGNPIRPGRKPKSNQQG